MTLTPSADPGFRELFDSHHAELHVFCLRRLSVDDANEAVAETFLMAWRRLRDMPAGIAPRLWLYRLALRVVETWIRRSAHRVRLAVADAPGSVVRVGAIQVVRHPAHDAVNRALESLRPMERAVVALQAWEELTEEEVAVVIDRPRKVVSARMAKTLSRMQPLLGPASAASADSVLDAVRACNPVPHDDTLPAGTLGRAALAHRIDQLASTPPDLAPLELDRRGGRGALLAVIVATAGVVGAILVALAIMSAAEQLAADTSPTSTVTVSTTTPLEPVPSLPGALPAGTPAVDVVDAMYERWSRADIDGYRALIDDTEVGYNLASFDHGAWYRALSGVVDVRSCRTDDPGHVRCTASYFSGLAHGRLIFEEETSFVVEGGRIVEIEPAEQLGLFNAGLDRDGLVDYRNWVFAHERDAFDELFAFGTSILLHTPELRDVHAELMYRYRAETSPTGPLRDAMPIKVVDTYYGHLRAADLAGARELVASTLPAVVALVPTEPDTWYADVTGVALGRICDTLSPIQVRCEETHYSGLAPGTELTGRTLLYTVLEGRIVAIEAVGPVEDHVIADEPALARYRAWLRTTDPTAAVDLFTSTGTLVLDSDAARAAHRGHIARFLAEEDA